MSGVCPKRRTTGSDHSALDFSVAEIVKPTAKRILECQTGGYRMAYSRWGQPLGVNLSEATRKDDAVDASIAWFQMPQVDRDVQTARQGGSASRWYIFWHTESDDSLGRFGQLLAVYKAGHGENPLIDYGELKVIAETDRWSLIPGYLDDDHPLDRENLKQCVAEWLSEVEEMDFPERPAPTRLELAQHWLEKARGMWSECRRKLQRDEPVNLGDGMEIMATTVRVQEIASRAAASEDSEVEEISRLAVAAKGIGDEVIARAKSTSPDEPPHAD